MEKQEQKQIIKVCYHCGREGLQNIIFRHNECIDYDKDNGVAEYYTWIVLSCPVCKMILLLQKYAFSEDIDQHGQPIVDEKIVFPATRLTKKNVPKSILIAFEEARQAVASALRLAALRRTLDFICKDKDADKIYKKENPSYKRDFVPLPDMLKILARENVLPAILSDSSWVVKELGNDGTHDSGEISAYHLEALSDIVENIIHYLYELPRKIKELKEWYLPEKEMPT